MPDEFVPGDSFSPGSPLTSEAQGSCGKLFGGGRASMSSAERKLFPLPFFARPVDKTGVSRCVKRRRERIQRMYDNCNEVVRSLNWLAGCQNDPSPSGVSGMQADVLARVEGLVFDQKPSGAVMSQEGALRELLHGGSPYEWKPISETIASYQADLLSVPEDVTGCPALSSVLPEDDLKFLEESSELMLKSDGDRPSDEMLVEPYWDPLLKFNKKAYNKLVQRLRGIGMFNYTTCPKCMVGVFFVWKSSRTKLSLQA